jgi:hypothetical protein
VRPYHMMLQKQSKTAVGQHAAEQRATLARGKMVAAN